MLTEEKANFLMTVEKIILDAFPLPVNGDKRQFRLAKAGTFRKLLSLHCTSSNKNVDKYSYVIVYKGVRLLRIDLNQGGPHTNPDGSVVSENHMHIYSEQYHDRYAYELSGVFKHPDDFLKTFYDILEYSNVVNRDEIQIVCQGVLFHGTNRKSEKMDK